MDPFQWPRHLPRTFASQNRAGDQRMQEVMRGWTCPLRWLLGVPNCIARLVPWHQVLSPCLAQKSDLAPATCFNLILWLLPDVSNAEAANIHAWIEFLAAVFGMYCISSVDLLWHVLECLFLYQQAKKLRRRQCPHQENSGLHNLPTVSCTGMTITKTQWTHWKTITRCSASSLLFFIGCPWSINEFLDCNSRGSCSRTRPYRSPRLLFMCMSWSDSGKLGNLETPANHL